MSLSGEGLRGAFVDIPLGRWLVAGLLTLASFAALGLQDAIAARVVVPGRVPLGKAVLAGSCANAVAGTLGFHAVTASLVRYRLYRAEGLGVPELAALASLSSAAVLLSFPATLSLAVILGPTGQDLAPLAVWLGAAFLLLVVLSLVWLGRRPRRLVIRGFVLDLPPARIAAWQIALGSAEMTAAIAALYVLLPAAAQPPFAAFALAHLTAVLSGLVSHVPGGLGIFEAAMMEFVGARDGAGVLAALLAYRLVYNLAPFAVAAAGLTLYELAGRSSRRFSSRADRA